MLAAGGAVSARQILLHIVPGSGSYGDAFFGLHFYTWALIVFSLIVIGSVVGYSAYLGAPVAAHPAALAWLQKVQARPAMQIEA
mgnify:CR=1 FL=1